MHSINVAISRLEMSKVYNGVLAGLMQKLLPYQTFQVPCSCLGAPSFDKGYYPGPPVDPVAKFLSCQTALINFLETHKNLQISRKILCIS